MIEIILALHLTWTVPSLDARGRGPAGCAECAVLHVPQKTGVDWWRQPTVYDTLAKLPAVDGTVMGYFVPLYIWYGTSIVICRDSSYNWSRHSNYTISKDGK